MITMLAAGAGASPADPFAGSARSFETKAPEAKKLEAGEWGVSEQTGAVTWTYPIVAPPARQGMGPELALRYSSHSPLRGGIAVGTTLDVPTIRLEPGPMGQEPRYVSTLGGASRLVPSIETAIGLDVDVDVETYRAELGDGSFARYEYMPPFPGDGMGHWNVYTLDGRHYHFGGEILDRWFLQSVTDPFGNEILYDWDSTTTTLAGEDNVAGSLWLREVQYTGNPGAGLLPHASITFEYEDPTFCGGQTTVPVGAALEVAPGMLYLDGAMTLKRIHTWVRDSQSTAFREVRTITLGYDEAAMTCDGPTAPLRMLSSVQEQARSTAGVWTVMPPVTLSWGARERSFSTSIYVDSPPGLSGLAYQGNDKGTTGTLMDVDGDGLLDRAEAHENGHCYLRWYRGHYGGGYDATPIDFELPTLPWTGNGSGPDPGTPDACTLSGQITFYRNTAYGFACPHHGTQLSYHFYDVDADGRVDLVTNIWHSMYFPYPGAHFPPTAGTLQLGGVCPAGLDVIGEILDANGNATPVCGCQQNGEGIGVDEGGDPICTPIEEVEGGGGGGDPGDPPPEDEPCGDRALGERRPEADGVHYIWRVYRNTGSEFGEVVPFPGEDRRAHVVVESDVSLPPNAPESIHEFHTPWSMAPTLIDLDGDQLLDILDVTGGAVDADDHPVHQLNQVDWRFWRGHAGVTFGGSPQWRIPRYDSSDIGFPVFGGATNGWIPDSDSDPAWSVRHVIVDLVDVNGDNRPDLLAQDNVGLLIAYLNEGGSFRDQGVPLGVPSSVELTRTRFEECVSPGGYCGERHHDVRLLDVDGDGLVDHVRPDTGAYRLNTGAGFLPWSPTTAFDRVDYLARDMTLDFATAAPGTVYRWWLDRDWVDVTGDGRPDPVTWTPLGGFALIDAADDGPPHLLRAVDNGRGGSAEFTYAPSTDPDVVAVLDATARLPQARWVVATVTSRALPGGEPSTTTYRYTNPIYGSETGRAGDPQRFLGFQTVTTALPPPGEDIEGARVEHGYTYSIPGVGMSDARGHLVSEARYNRAPPGDLDAGSLRLDTYRETTWTMDPLLDGSIGFTHPARTLSRVCGDLFRAPADPPGERCRDFTNDARNVVREEQTWEPWTLPCEGGCEGATVLYLQTGALLSAGLIDGDGDRRTFMDYEVRYAEAGTTDYRALPIFDQREELDDIGGYNVWRSVGRTETGYNAAGLPETTAVWLDESTPATTIRDFDATGNVIAVYKPEQYDPAIDRASPHVSLGYDSHKLYVATAINELGHLVTTMFDAGTGVQLSSLGPNVAQPICQCGTPFCPPPAPGTSICRRKVWDAEFWALDGFGRVLNHRVAVDNTSGTYTNQVVDQYTYEDFAIPNQVVAQRLKDYGGSEWVTAVSEIDGAGRVTKETQPLAVLPDAETTYAYDRAGNLTSILTPDPREDTGAAVEFRFQHDALGRPTSFLRPDGGGTSVFYDGLATVIREDTTDGSGSLTEQLTDVFGRLVAVFEGVGPVNATTTYSYDAHDQLREVRSADGDLTTLAHDWAGRRVSITRGDRTWRYEYDRNGNLRAEISPVPTGGAEADYKTTYQHDALDRITRKDPAPRELAGDPARRSELGIGAIVYRYDTPDVTNSIGRLGQVDLFGGDEPEPWGGVTYEYQARGLVSREQRTVGMNSLASLPPTTMQVTRIYNALGSLLQSTWDDGQTWRTIYDERGLADVVQWDVTFDLDPLTSPTWQTVADYLRSLACAPRQRLTGYGQSRSFTYDAIGRPTDDTINVTSGGTTVSRAARSYSYTQTGDVATVAGHNLGAGFSAAYGYDRLHRLVTAGGPSTPYAATFAYSPAGNLQTANVTISGPAEVLPRQVTYEYGATDPQAVDRLVNPDGTSWASFTYDASGNVVYREVPGMQYLLTWDGDDQLREVLTAGGGQEIYFYDHTGQRILAQSATGTRWWFAEMEDHFDATGTPLTEYLHLSDSGGPLARIENGYTPELQYADALQNLILSLDTSGTAKADFVYSPFGEIISSSGAENHRKQFNGKEHDAVSGLRYYGARHYDPISLRWSSGDPLYRFAPDIGLVEPLRLNLYAFSGNNPLRYLDPDGRDFSDWLPGVYFARQAAREYNAARAAADRGDVEAALGHNMQAQGYAQGAILDLVATFIPGGAQAKITVGGLVRTAQAAAKAGTEAREAAQVARAIEVQEAAARATESALAARTKEIHQAATATGGGKAFSSEKQALVDMAKADKKAGGISRGDMKAYKELNEGLPDPFPADKVRGPEAHPLRTPNSKPGAGQQPHGHVGPVDHIPIRDEP